MKRIIFIFLVIVSIPIHIFSAEKRVDRFNQWPQWRGPLGTGVAPHGNPPTTWSENENIRWKIKIPGKGHSTPIIWNDRIFVTTAVPYGKDESSRQKPAPGAHDNLPSLRRQKFLVLAINRRDGTILWKYTVRDQRPHEGIHITGSWASSSPVTDGRNLFAFFGSRGIYCFDMNGTLIWEKNIGDMRTKHGHGEGSSPALYGNTLIINWDHEGDSFIIAMDKNTGKQRWKIAREENSSWSTPLVVKHNGKHQVIVSATTRVRAYDLDSGNLIWECGGLSRNVVASPVAADGFVYLASSYGIQSMFAIKLDGAKGDITHTDSVIWKIDQYTPYVSSPLLYADMLFFLSHLQGYITCLHAKTGVRLFGPQRLTAIQQVFASPVGASGHIYIVSRNGTTVVIKRSEQFELLSSNRLDDQFSASPAIAGNEIYLRGEQYLYCIAK